MWLTAFAADAVVVVGLGDVLFGSHPAPKGAAEAVVDVFFLGPVLAVALLIFLAAAVVLLFLSIAAPRVFRRNPPTPVEVPEARARAIAPRIE